MALALPLLATAPVRAQDESPASADAETVTGTESITVDVLEDSKGDAASTDGEQVEVEATKWILSR